MKSSTLKVVAEVRSTLDLCFQLESKVPRLKTLSQSLKLFADWLSTLAPTPPLPVLGLCVKEPGLAYSEIEQKILSSLIRKKLLLSVCYLKASRDASLDPEFLLKTQEMIDQKD